MNYFELFGLPVSFIIDRDLLKERYFSIQKKQHPDFFTQATEAEQNEALELSALANKGLRTLKDQAATIAYVLEIKGRLKEGEKYELSPAFLMEMMELNEALDTHSRDQVTAIEKELFAEVKDAIEQYNDDTSTEADLIKIKDYYYKQKYLQRILDRIAG